MTEMSDIVCGLFRDLFECDGQPFGSPRFAYKESRTDVRAYNGMLGTPPRMRKSGWESTLRVRSTMAGPLCD